MGINAVIDALEWAIRKNVVVRLSPEDAVRLLSALGLPIPEKEKKRGSQG